MLFSSAVFLLLFFPLFLPLYIAAPNRFKNAVVLVSSLIFYAWGGFGFLPILIVSLTLDHWIGTAINRSHTSQNRKWLLGIGVSLNVLILTYVKYANFFMDNVNSLLGELGIESVGWTRIALPLGISFFTFQKISFLIDTYRKESVPQKSLADYALFVVLFPQLIAGPIVRYNQLAQQIRERRNNINLVNFLNGMFRFSVGLAKKLFVADVLAGHVDVAFSADVNSMSMLEAWLGVSAFAFQVYFDFSAYSDIAIGIGSMLGFNIPENFNFPYKSRSTTEFWRRWHITLGSWFKDYLYVPMGGNRGSIFRTYFNLWFIFVLCGAWHGASWTFVIWGCYNGVFITLDKLFLKRGLDRLGALPGTVIFFVSYLIGLAIFRSNGLEHAFDYLEKMFSLANFKLAHQRPDNMIWFSYGLAAIVSFLPMIGGVERMGSKVYDSNSSASTILKFVTSFVFIALSMTEVISSGFNPFVYFRF